VSSNKKKERKQINLRLCHQHKAEIQAVSLDFITVGLPCVATLTDINRDFFLQKKTSG